MVHLLEPAPQTQTATAHLHGQPELCTLMVKVSRNYHVVTPPPRGGGLGGGIGWLMVYQVSPRRARGVMSREVKLPGL